jgi:DNA-binding winged helix-turn-helix (wHTH) protein/TolB-like protein
MSHIYRFGVFRFDAEQLELQRDGQSVRLQRQPAQVLAMLLNNAGAVVTRDALRQAVWGNDTFVDFDRGLNFCIAQIRTALKDDAGTPRYVQTIPKKGYQFICPVEVVDIVATDASRDVAVALAQPSPPSPGAPSGRRAAAALAAVLVCAVIAVALYSRAVTRPERLIVAVARFDNETGDAALTRFSDYLTDTVVEQLTETSGGSYEVVGNAAILRTAREQRDLRAIAASLHARYIVIGQVQRDAAAVRVLAHLIRLPEQTHVAVARFEDVREQTLAKTQEIAARVTQDFARRLKASPPHVSLQLLPRSGLPADIFLASRGAELAAQIAAAR